MQLLYVMTLGNSSQSVGNNNVSHESSTQSPNQLTPAPQLINSNNQPISSSCDSLTSASSNVGGHTNSESSPSPNRIQNNNSSNKGQSTYCTVIRVISRVFPGLFLGVLFRACIKNISNKNELVCKVLLSGQAELF